MVQADSTALGLSLVLPFLAHNVVIMADREGTTVLKKVVDMEPSFNHKEKRRGNMAE